MDGSSCLKRPRLYLAACFALWKSLLLLIALSCPGLGYDTSTSLLFTIFSGGTAAEHTRLLDAVPYRLTKWDAIYFVPVAHRGYQWEQEWAFGWGFSQGVGLIARSLFGADASLRAAAVTAIAVAHLNHFLSVLLLFGLASKLGPPAEAVRTAFVCALLHIVAPAGIFLSSPFAESTFAMLQFAGLLLYAEGGRQEGKASVKRDLSLLASGLVFGLSCTARSNGIMSGVMFALDAATWLQRLGSEPVLSLERVRRLICIVVGGASIAVGFAVPQYIAWAQFCTVEVERQRPWCSRTIPSIYAFVQEYYWDVGFLRYWKSSHLAFFVMALPMLSLMFLSSWRYLDLSAVFRRPGPPGEKKVQTLVGLPESDRHSILARMALPQLLLSCLMVTNFHIQIVTRVAAAYPLVYLFMAEQAAAVADVSSREPRPRRKWVRFALGWMVMYGLIQAGLFASFLPPA